MTTRRDIDRYIHTLCEQQERATRAWPHKRHEHDIAIICRNDAALAIRLVFSAMRRRIEELEREVNGD